MNKKGITLIALVITILVLLIITSTSVYFGLNSTTKTNNFRIYSNLSLIYPKIEDISEKHDFNAEVTGLIGYELTNEMKNTLNSPPLNFNTDSNSWRFLTEENLDELLLPRKIKEPGTNIFVDYDTLEIVYTKGYKKPDGTYVYSYSEMKEIESNNLND